VRILLLSDLYPPIIGGIEQHVQNLGRALAGMGHSVAVATVWHDGRPEYEVDSGVRVYRIRGLVQRATPIFHDTARRYAAPFPDPGLMKGLRRVLAEERPHIVHAHNWLVHSFLPLKRRSGAKLVVTLHDYSLVCAKKSLLYRDGECTGPAPLKCIRCAVAHYGAAKGLPMVTGNWAMSALERSSVDAFVAVSTAVARGNQLGERSLAFRVIPNFVPDEVARADGPAQPIGGLPTDDYILFVGALGRHKGIDVLMRAYSRLENPPPLVLIGATWPDTPEQFPSSVRVIKNVSHDAVMQAWRRALLGVIPSIYPDPCPTVAMEAMASGRALIASRIGGLPDLVADGDNGLLVPAGDDDALWKALNSLLSDAKLRHRMGEAGRVRVGRFTASAVVDQIDRLYRDVLMGPVLTQHETPDELRGLQS
jgi:glycosyltransferase involved in cell wall biosynthesis